MPKAEFQDFLLQTLQNFHFAPTLARWPSAQYCSGPEQKGGSQWALGSCVVPAQREAGLSGDFTRSTKTSRSFLSRRELRGGREPRTASNKLTNKSDPLRGQRVHYRSLFPPSDRWAGQRLGKPKVRAHAVSPQSTPSLWHVRATQRQRTAATLFISAEGPEQLRGDDSAQVLSASLSPPRVRDQPQVKK